MITKLKRRFIALAMASLTVLLIVIVAGMNIINYNTVISDADAKLSVISRSGGILPFVDDFFNSMDPDRSDYDSDDRDYDDPEDRDYDDIDARTRDEFFGRGNPFISRDEAEETRFFSVLTFSDGTVIAVNTDRIFAVDETSAVNYAKKVMKSGKAKGFVKEYRYVVASEGSLVRITFLDCTSSLAAFRQFLYASIAMSVCGLLVVFAFICYFAGRIVKPVAESYEKQKRFITDAGHEIKTPLAIIKANIDLMRMDLADVEAASHPSDGSSDGTDGAGESAETADVLASISSLDESLEDIDGQVDRLTTLTNDLVYLSRMEEAGDTLTMTEIPVSDIVSETADSFSALAEERKKELNIDVAPMLSMQGSVKEIEKLVSILVENALKYSPEGDTVGVDLHKEGKTIVLEVRNKAVTPLSDEDLAHVFDRFYRTDKSRNSEAGGHGIGLSVASAITTAHGGKIRARSGDGTEFIVTVSLPAA